MEIYKTECQKCGCLFEYDKTEIVIGALKDPFTGNDLLYVECPRCKNLTEHETREHISNNEISEIAKMQQQIDTFKAALLHINERITHGNKCNLVYAGPLDDNDKHFINNIIRFIDQHAHAPEKDITLEDIVAPAFKNDKSALEDYCSKMNDAAKNRHRPA